MRKFFALTLLLLLFIQPSFADQQVNLEERARRYFEENEERLLKELYYQIILRLIIDEDFEGRTPSEREKFYGALKGIVGSTGDRHSQFFGPEEFKNIQESFEGSYGGIGIKYINRPMALEVVEVSENTPAEKAGLETGDMIYKIGGVWVSDLSDIERVARMRGKAGESLRITVFKHETQTYVELEIVRENIRSPERRLSWRVEGGIVIVSLPIFSQSVSGEFAEAAKEIDKLHPNLPIVLDLRNNGGGKLSVCKAVASFWLRADQVLLIEKVKGKEFPSYPSNFVLESGPGAATAIGSGHPPYFAQRKTAVLINQYSASASEIFAGAFQDYAADGVLNSRLFGTRTYGKGSVQRLRQIFITGETAPAVLSLTVEKWLTPKGRHIDGMGVAPDVVIELTRADREAGRDPQLERAIEWLKTGK